MGIAGEFRPIAATTIAGKARAIAGGAGQVAANRSAAKPPKIRPGTTITLDAPLRQI